MIRLLLLFFTVVFYFYCFSQQVKFEGIYQGVNGGIESVETGIVAVDTLGICANPDTLNAGEHTITTEIKGELTIEE